jgi:hypothetical protein
MQFSAMLKEQMTPLVQTLAAMLFAMPLWLVTGPRAQANQHEPWVLAALETELGPRFAAAVAAAARQARHGVAVVGVWSAPEDDCRTAMLVIAPGDRPDGFQDWRRVAPGGTMAPVRIGRWQEEGGALSLAIAQVADPAGVDLRSGYSGTSFRPLEQRGGVGAGGLWRMSPSAERDRWSVLEATAERLRLRMADGAERVLARCRVVVFRPDGRPAEAVIP